MTRKPKARDWADKQGEKYAAWSASNKAHIIARALRAAYRRGAKEEREACAAMFPDTVYGRAVAAAIRARGGR